MRKACVARAAKRYSVLYVLSALVVLVRNDKNTVSSLESPTGQVSMVRPMATPLSFRCEAGEPRGAEDGCERFTHVSFAGC
jgi:hypothetical protein